LPDSFAREEIIPENKLLPNKDYNAEVKALMALSKIDDLKKKEELKEQKFNNSKTQLYTVFELNLLKQKYLDSCYVETDQSLIKFVAELEEKCQKIADNWNVIY
jgi:GTPase Era involved in 16S rRNA processing